MGERLNTDQTKVDILGQDVYSKYTKSLTVTAACPTSRFPFCFSVSLTSNRRSLFLLITRDITCQV